MSDQPTGTLTLSELPELRRKTEAVSRFLRDQIAAHLETLRPLFGPERILGKHAGGKTEVQGAERVLTELQQNYRPFTRKPYDLPETLESSWLGLVGNSLELHPWEYIHPVQGKPITLTSPVKWVVNYKTNYNLAQVKGVLDGKQNSRPEFLRQFAVNALVLQSVLSRNAGLSNLFHDLRYEIKTESPADLKGLPVVTVTSFLGSFRPADDLIQAATAFSGVPAFIELIDLQSVQAPKDRVREKLEELAR